MHKSALSIATSDLEQNNVALLRTRASITWKINLRSPGDQPCGLLAHSFCTYMQQWRTPVPRLNEKDRVSFYVRLRNTAKESIRADRSLRQNEKKREREKEIESDKLHNYSRFQSEFLIGETRQI